MAVRRTIPKPVLKKSEGVGPNSLKITLTLDGRTAEHTVNFYSERPFIEAPVLEDIVESLDHGLARFKNAVQTNSLKTKSLLTTSPQ